MSGVLLRDLAVTISLVTFFLATTPAFLNDYSSLSSVLQSVGVTADVSTERSFNLSLAYLSIFSSFDYCSDGSRSLSLTKKLCSIIVSLLCFAPRCEFEGLRRVSSITCRWAYSSMQMPVPIDSTRL